MSTSLAAPEDDLAHRLAEAEATIHALLSGQIDAMVSPDNTTVVLLSKAQESLRASEERYRSIVETTNDGIWTVDANKIITFVNRRVTEMLGFHAGEMVGRPLFDFLNGDGQMRAEQRIEQTRAGVSTESESGVLRKDGTELWALIKASPIRGVGGAYAGTLATVTDYSGRREARAAVRKERDRAQRFLDSAEVMLVALDATGRVTLANRYACTILERTEDELLGCDWIETCTPVRGRAALTANFHAALGGGLGVAEYPVVGRSGLERLIEWRNTVQWDDTGRVSGIFSSGTDITERSRGEDALRAAEERTRFALRSAGVGIWDMDYIRNGLQWSALMAAQYGMPVGSFNGTFEAFIAGVHPEDRESVLETFGKAIRSGGDFILTNRALWPDGTVHWLEGTGRMHLDGAGNAVRALGISVDVTARHDIQEQFQQTHKMEAVGRLAGGVAHDFNNLLMVITGYSDLVLQELVVGDSRRDDIQQIRNAAEGAARLTRQLLAFSRQQVIKPAMILLEEVVSESLKMLERVIGEDVEVVVRLKQPPATVHMDPGQLEQVVMNLTLNARDALPTGGTITVETDTVELSDSEALAQGLAAAGRFATLCVIDNGHGIDDATKARIFEPFFTTKDQGKGTGLGLATAHGIAEQSGGAIRVASKPGEGAAFCVYLPLFTSSRTAGEPRDPDQAIPFGSETILIVEDSDAVRDITRRVLERQGYRVLTAPTAGAALQLSRRHDGDIHLLLTDVVMPEMSGRLLAERFADEHPAARILFMSGYTDDAVLRYGVQRAEMPYLQKPFSPKTLADRVRSVLDAA
ncbi:MAG: PAS domain S-box protein [Gemmatimonadaceae bacterium]